MRASARPRADERMTLADGRMLAFSEWGDPTGRPVVLMHGAPGSRRVCPDEDATAAAGVRLPTVDRPGSGGSDPRPDPSLLGCDALPWQVDPQLFGRKASEVGQGLSRSGAAWRQRAMVLVTMAKPKPRSSMGAQAMRGPRITAGL
jgi:pimeloyl-ACP methyl ester carboxylesterase